MEFVWDLYKQSLNIQKHGINFEKAALIFHDPLIISVLDHRYFTEECWYSIGLVNETIIYVAHTIEENEYEKEIIRIISARTATPREQQFYFSHR